MVGGGGGGGGGHGPGQPRFWMHGRLSRRITLLRSSTAWPTWLPTRSALPCSASFIISPRCLALRAIRIAYAVARVRTVQRVEDAILPVCHLANSAI
jgi:hypothetical protein